MTKLLETSFKKTKNKEQGKIDIIALLKILWSARRLIIRTILVFMALGIFIAVFSEKEYTASTTIVPQSSKKSGGNLSGLAAIAGINLGSFGEESSISPQLYPQILNNISFQKEMLETPLTIVGQEKKVTYREYYTIIYKPSLLVLIKKYTIGLPRLFIGLFKSEKASNGKARKTNSLIHITNEDKEMIDLLKSQLLMYVNDKDGYITLSAKMPEAKSVAELTKRAQVLLEQYVIDFKIEKAVSQLDFIKKRYLEKEKEFKKTQEKFSTYSDQNQNINSVRAKTKMMQLQSEYDLTYGVYAELAKQLEAQEIKVKEDTPIFTIIEPVFVPIDRTKPKRIFIFLTWTFLGALVSICFVFGKVALLQLKEAWLTQKK